MGSKRSPEEEVEDFVRDPASATDDPREKQRYLERKAQDDARKKRERAGKRKRPPTLEQILADVVRVAEDAETNPFHKHRSVSRRRYELYGHYPIEFVLKHGRFEHVKQMAKLVPNRGDQRLVHARTYQSLREHDVRYFNRHVAPHVDKFPELRRATDQTKMAVFISDTHSLFMDPFTWIAFLAFIEDVQPDVVIWGGDHIDGSEISTHVKPYNFSTPLQVEFDCFTAMLREARERCPRSRFVWIGSNHFTDRMVRHLSQTDPALAGLRSMKIDQLVDLEGLEVDVAHGGSFLSPPGQEDDEPRVRLWESFTATHGTKTGKFPAMAELMSWGDSGVSGHVHRDQIVKGPVTSQRHHTWACSPSGVIDGCARYYVKGANPAWSRGWTVIEKGRKALQFTTANTTENEVMCNGWYYTAKGRIPSGVEAVRKFWNRRFSL